MRFESRSLMAGRKTLFCVPRCSTVARKPFKMPVQLLSASQTYSNPAKNHGLTKAERIQGDISSLQRRPHSLQLAQSTIMMRKWSELRKWPTGTKQRITNLSGYLYQGKYSVHFLNEELAGVWEVHTHGWKFMDMIAITYPFKYYYSLSIW